MSEQDHMPKQNMLAQPSPESAPNPQSAAPEAAPVSDVSGGEHDLAAHGAAQAAAEAAATDDASTMTSAAGEASSVAAGASSESQPQGGGEVIPTAAAKSVDELQAAADEAVLAESRRHTRRAFVVAAAGVAAGYGFYRWVDGAPAIEMQPGPLRHAFQANAAIARAVFQDRALTPTYPLKDARDLRVNGVYGLKKMLAPEGWRLQLVGARDAAMHPRYTNDVTAWDYKYVDEASHEDQGHDTKVDPNAWTSEKMAPEPMLNQAKAEEDRDARMPRGKEEAGESYSTLMPGTPGLLLTMEDILTLPRYELVTQFKCIEGWSQIVHWAGVRMADFLEAYPPTLVNGNEPKYVYMETPDGDYYTGYDMNVCRHPQTLLVTEMMGVPLTQYHGAPLRLHMPTKYGYKQIKRIGLISYTNRKPDDYWTKLGYDWYAGL